LPAEPVTEAQHSAADHAATSSAAHRTVGETAREFPSHSVRRRSGATFDACLALQMKPRRGSDRGAPRNRGADHEQPDQAQKTVAQPFALPKTTRVMPHLELAHRINPKQFFPFTTPVSSGTRASRVDLSQRSPNNDLRVARRREHRRQSQGTARDRQKTNGAASADPRARASPALAAAAPSLLSMRESAAASPNRLFRAALRSAGQSTRESLPTRAPQGATGRETSPPLSRSKPTSASPLPDAADAVLLSFPRPFTVARRRVNGGAFTRTREAGAGLVTISKGRRRSPIGFCASVGRHQARSRRSRAAVRAGPEVGSDELIEGSPGV
jgi:hypothetical protein